MAGYIGTNRSASVVSPETDSRYVNESELTSSASVKAINQGVATTDSPTFTDVTAGGNSVLALAGDLNQIITGQGIGPSGSSVPNNNVDDIVNFGSYKIISTTVSNSPALTGMGVSSGSSILHFTYDAVNAAQILIVHPSAQTYTRTNDGGAWTPFAKQFSTANILGTVSQSGGAPTGAVIQRGTNANGEFVRFADGTQICVSPDFSGVDVTTAMGNIFRNASPIDWSFPVVFAGGVDTVAGSVTSMGNSQSHWGSFRVTGGAGADISVFSAQSFTGRTVRAMAVGRWF